MQIQQINVAANVVGQGFKAPFPSGGKVLSLTPMQQGNGFTIHVFCEDDHILADKEFVLVPSGITFKAPCELNYLVSFLNIHLFEATEKKVLIV